MAGLDWLYHSIGGRCCLKVLTARPLSRLAGALLDTGASRVLIRPFVRRGAIDLTDYDLSDIHSFNQFFCRPLRSGARPVCTEPEALISPCDGLLTVVPLESDTVLPVKQSAFTLRDLLRSEGLARRYEGGTCLIFRLRVDHYHRYAYIESGDKSPDRFIPGRLHTVRPVALSARPVFTENCRSYCLIKTAVAGTVLQMEVGAMLVGRICNDQPGAAYVSRGEEKGHFAYGGSTVIVLTQADRVRIDEKILASSAEGAETPVVMGQKIGTLEGSVV